MESSKNSGLFKCAIYHTKRLLLLFKSHLKATVGQRSRMFKPLLPPFYFDQKPHIKFRFKDTFIEKPTNAVFSAFSFQVNTNQGFAI
jgi:hypothetical protein